MADLYCVCRGVDDGSMMLGCDICDEWFHIRCVSIDPAKAATIENYICPACVEQAEIKLLQKQIVTLENAIKEVELQYENAVKQESKLSEAQSKPTTKKRMRRPV